MSKFELQKMGTVKNTYASPRMRCVPLTAQSPLCSSNDGQTENYDEEDIWGN